MAPSTRCRLCTSCSWLAASSCVPCWKASPRLASWAALLADLAGSGYPALRTIQRWCASFRDQSARWLKVVQEWLAQQDSLSGWLDAQGDALKAGSPEQALLAASEHLLAWGKSQRAEMAEYGLDKRLHFLWLWGTGADLGRLV